MNRYHLEQIIDARRNSREAALVTNLADGAQQLRFRDNQCGDDSLTRSVKDAFRRCRSMRKQVDDVDYFIQVFSNPLRLVIVGAVHIAKPLIEMSRLCGYSVALVDPRLAFASEQRFPQVECIRQWPDEALRDIDLDNRTAVVTLAHDPKLDEPALATALESEVFYIGALGSRRTHQARCERLMKSGISGHQLERIHGPIGLNIGAESPAEIAVSIVAEMTESLHRMDNS